MGRGRDRGRAGLLAACMCLLVLGSQLVAVPANAGSNQSTAAPAGVDLVGLVTALAPGQTLKLPPGVFTLTEPLQLPAGSKLVGSGHGTVLRLSRSHWENFHYGFAVAPRDGATNVTVRSLTIDGNRSNHSGDRSPNPPADTGGGVKLGSGWDVNDVRFTNLNYFNAWIHSVHSVTLQGSTFDAASGSSGRKDNVGGGRSRGITVRDNDFAATAAGNAIDLVGVQDVTISGNTVTGSSRRERSIYLEGVTRAKVSGNKLQHGAITVTTDANYESAGRAINPAKVTISGNSVSEAPASAITISYGTGDSGMRTGGGNRVSNNTVHDSGLTGIAIIHCVPDATTNPDRITGNTVVDSFARGDTTWGTGCGTVASSGIAVTAGSGTVISGNSVTQTPGASGISFGIYLGATRALAELANPSVSNNTTSSGVTETGWAS